MPPRKYLPRVDVVTAGLRHVQERIERSCARLGLSYPWWIPAYSTVAAIAITIAAFAQRGTAASSPAVIIALVLTVAPLAVWGFRGWWLVPPWIQALAAAAAVALYLTHPVSPDFAPLLFLISAGEVAATSKKWLGLLVAALDIAILIVADQLHHLQNAPIYVVGVILGADVGIALRWQMRALAAERDKTSIAQEQAILAERQRLAREVHDVVGHSLSINLLHVTAARHALQRHGDVEDAVESLMEAERVGRTAIGDLRRTVSVLSSGPSETQALPGIADLPTLVEQSRTAGLDVRFEQEGECADAGDATSLGVFRIVQECLANIAKHAPTSTATVHLDTPTGRLHLSVRNTLPDGRPSSVTGGTGLPGMAARAEQIGGQLRAGVDGDCWLVELTAGGDADTSRLNAPTDTACGKVVTR
jgi:signal transduction histidine kinase